MNPLIVLFILAVCVVSIVFIPSKHSTAGMSQELLRLINEQRPGHELILDETLNSVAQWRAVDMASKGYFSHMSPSGETAFDRLREIDFYAPNAGEVIARNNYPHPTRKAVEAWIESPSHRDILIDPVFKIAGIGIALREDVKYYCIILVGGNP